MAQKITVTIPDELHERLQAVKGDFNVSAECADAIERKVRLSELRRKGDESMEGVIERLQAEKEEFNAVNRENGHKEGLEDAKSLSYVVLKEIEKEYTPVQNHYELSEYEHLLPDIERIIREHGLEFVEETIEGAEKDDPYFDRDEFLLGWTEGVMEFWEEIKDQL